MYSLKVSSARTKLTFYIFLEPRIKKNWLPILSSTQHIKIGDKVPIERVLSFDRSSLWSKVSQRSSFSTLSVNKSNEAIKSKLEYEWKSIFRVLSTIDVNSSGVVSK